MATECYSVTDKNGVTGTFVDSTARSSITILNRNGVYPYNDAVELDYSWADLNAMTATGEYEDLRIGDYKTITVGTDTCVMELAGMDTETKSGDSGYEVPHHLDWISRDCLTDTVQWNTTATNNGNSTEAAPYMISNVYAYLTGTVYALLPSDVKAVIKSKRALIASRYSSSGTIDSSTTWVWRDLGYLWLPSEVEVYGQTVWGETWSTGNSSQYPIFRDGWSHRVKGVGNGGSRCYWWLRDVRSSSSTHACLVGGDGAPSRGAVTNSYRVPLCFRLAANAA